VPPTARCGFDERVACTITEIGAEEFQRFHALEWFAVTRGGQPWNRLP
jgi:hypothetical protein